MVSLKDLQSGGARLRKGPASSGKGSATPKPADPGPATPEVEGLQRLEFLMEQGQLPAYLRVKDQPPPDLPPTAWARQAQKEWPLVSANLSLPHGVWVTWTAGGTVHRVGPHYLEFDLLTLWRTLQLVS